MNIIPFPRPELPPDKGVVRVTASGEGIIVKCEGIIHVFGEVPGRCQCGFEWWDGSIPESEEAP